MSAPATTTISSSLTSHVVNLPSCSAGDLLRAFAGVRNPGTWSLASGWVELGSANAGGVGELTVFYKVADGSEGATATFVASTPTTGAWHVRAIAAADWDGSTAPEAAFANSGGIPGSAPNPPSLTPSWGAEDTLWDAVAATAAESIAGASAYPSGYGGTPDAAWTAVSAGGASCAVGSTYRAANTATEDPGAFTPSAASRWWMAATVAVRPPSGSSPEVHEGEGTASIVLSITGTGHKVAADSGTVSLVVAPTGSGRKVGVGAAAASLVAALTGAGRKLAAGAGTVSAAIGLSGGGTKRAAGEGSAEVRIALTGAGAKRAIGEGTISQVIQLTGTSSETGEGEGAISIAIGLSGSGAKRAAGLGNVGLVLTISGSGAKIAASSGTIAAIATVSGAGVKVGAGSGHIELLIDLTGEGEAQPIAGGLLGFATAAHERINGAHLSITTPGAVLAETLIGSAEAEIARVGDAAVSLAAVGSAELQEALWLS